MLSDVTNGAILPGAGAGVDDEVVADAGRACPRTFGLGRSSLSAEGGLAGAVERAFIASDRPGAGIPDRAVGFAIESFAAGAGLGGADFSGADIFAFTGAFAGAAAAAAGAGAGA